MEHAPYIYTDFNAFEYMDDERIRGEIPLTGYGTLASLARQRLRLVEGMMFVAYEPNEIECAAIAHFDPTRSDPAGRRGEWVAVIEARLIRESAQDREESNRHPCSKCSQDLRACPTYQRSYSEVCPFCGTSVMTPLDPPQ